MPRASPVPEERPPLSPGALLALRQARREKRELRREKQRELNLGRVRKMRAARLAHEKQTPPPPVGCRAGPSNEPLLKKPTASAVGSPSNVQTSPAQSNPPKFNIGCSGWFYWHWRDTFYPAGLPTKSWFPHYASHFPTVELNAPFYAWPTLANVETWVKQAAASPNFIYTVKVSELITHLKRFKGTATQVKDFSHIATLLGPRMGCFLYQLPPSFHFTPARLKSIVTQLAPLSHLRNVVEFRHKTWWNEKTYAAFRKAGIIFCSVSAPRLPDTLIQTAPDLYLRFHGLKTWYRYNYSTEELRLWAEKIKALDPARTWCYFNNDREGHALRNARELSRLLIDPSLKNKVDIT